MSELFIKTFVFIQTHFESVYVHPYTHSAISLDLGYNLVMWKVISSKEIQWQTSGTKYDKRRKL